VKNLRSGFKCYSSIRRLAALILRPDTNLFWSECINFGKTTFNLSARIVAIRNLSLMPWIFQRTWYYYFVKQLREGCRIAEEKPIYKNSSDKKYYSCVGWIKYKNSSDKKYYSFVGWIKYKISSDKKYYSCVGWIKYKISSDKKYYSCVGWIKYKISSDKKYYSCVEWIKYKNSSDK
jgi:hypothetical protein